MSGLSMRNVEVPNWLKGLPLAPEFRPTDTEFADPIAYISKIEKEASAFGICKVIPPLPKPSKKFVLANLNNSLSKCPELGSDINLMDVCSMGKLDDGDKGTDGEIRAVFTTRQQELGQSLKKCKGMGQPQPPVVLKQVWQSGEIYTLEQFESKSKAFARSQLGMVKELSPLVIESLFWKAASEKPIYVEYANDVPGSGFGELEGPFRYLHRRRRRRQAFNRNSWGSYDNHRQKANMRNANSVCKDAFPKHEQEPCTETSREATCSQSIPSNQTSSRQKGSNAANKMEATAGWKLSNSPWNLQVIARSPGSLTRYMPDDIPGVTSPMVYIGMLFSWFAWHVEDHELHSLNFLHTGSPKTWYAVPGNYASTFEEVIREQAYGGDIDRLAALTLLGEKTTLLSPELVAASGIPCCRLVQNPGEFVVTFPRAYHVGFSHGFNCGEAANFGTPKWLEVAKEAAVRRAAMNYLPMLSHQQLLYLLTMSFILRLPRSLLPGVRTSRLSDRQREERELLVKKAFLEDILSQNNLLTVLLEKHSSFHAVFWDLESLPSSSKESELCSSLCSAAITPRENVDMEINDNHDLLTQMSLYMETVNDLYLDVDLSSDFQVDSGPLPCVACGILGFPFMAVVQPTEKASAELLLKDFQESQNAVMKSAKPHMLSDLDSILECSVSAELTDQDDALNGKTSSACSGHFAKISSANCWREVAKISSDKISLNVNGLSDATGKLKQNESNMLLHASGEPCDAELIQPCLDESVLAHYSLQKDSLFSSEVEFGKCWNTSDEFLRPRIFCLEHAIQIEELLHSKGGANVLVICHSDFQKIKAHATAVAEEIGIPFKYNEIPMDKASSNDLNLINLAINDEEQDEYGEDWTSKLGINLRHCVNVRKNFPHKKLQQALSLIELFSDITSNSNASRLKWQSRKTRSKRKFSHPALGGPSISVQIKKDEDLRASTVGPEVRKEVKLIQYSRKRFKSKPCSSAGANKVSEYNKKLLSSKRSASVCTDPDKNCRSTSYRNSSCIQITGNVSEGGGVLDSCEKSELQHEIQVPVTTGDLKNSVLLQVAGSFTAAVGRSVETLIGDHVTEPIFMEERTCISSTDDKSMLCEIKAGEESSDPKEKYNSQKWADLLEEPVRTEKLGVETEKLALDIRMEYEACELVSTGDFGETGDVHGEGDVLMKEVFDTANTSGCIRDPPVGCFDEQMDKIAGEKFSLSDDVSECQTLDDKSELENHITSEDNKKMPTSGDNVPIDETEEDASVIDVSDPAWDHPVGCSDEQVERATTEIFCMGSELADCEALDEKSELGSHTSTVDNKQRPVSSDNSPMDEVEFAHNTEELPAVGESCSSPGKEMYETDQTIMRPRSTVSKRRKRKREVELPTEDLCGFNGFVKSPCEGLRPRARRYATNGRMRSNKTNEEKPKRKDHRKPSSDGCIPRSKDKKEHSKGSHRCDLEGCRMRFQTKAELVLHKCNQCPYEGCQKKFSSHKYAMLHQRVHEDDRPLKCSWKGCSTSFKWAWARTEHMRLHTGERPYKCSFEGCGLTFRFVSDFSRHRRKTGHYVNTSN